MRHFANIRDVRLHFPSHVLSLAALPSSNFLLLSDVLIPSFQSWTFRSVVTVSIDLNLALGPRTRRFWLCPPPLSPHSCCFLYEVLTCFAVSRCQCSGVSFSLVPLLTLRLFSTCCFALCSCHLEAVLMQGNSSLGYAQCYVKMIRRVFNCGLLHIWLECSLRMLPSDFFSLNDFYIY